MNAELKDYLDRMFLAITDQLGRMDERLTGVEQRLTSVEQRLEAMHLEFTERFIAVGERFDSLELRLEQFEGRINDRVDRVEAEVSLVRAALERTDRRVLVLEKHGAGLNTRFDGLAEDMRQRFRVLNEQLSALRN